MVYETSRDQMPSALTNMILVYSSIGRGDTTYQLMNYRG